MSVPRKHSSSVKTSSVAPVEHEHADTARQRLGVLSAEQVQLHHPQCKCVGLPDRGGILQVALSPPLFVLSAGTTWWTQGRWTLGEAKAILSKLLMTTPTKVTKHWVALFQLVSGC